MRPSAMLLSATLLVATLAGVLLTANPRALPAQSSAAPTPFAYSNLPRLKLVETMRLDATTEDFSVIRRIAVSRRGVIAVPMSQDMIVRIYDSTGKRIGAVGRKGEGPGEFQDVSAPSWVGDSLFVLDGRQLRMTYFGANLKLLRTVPLRMGSAAPKAPTDSAFYRFLPFVAYANGDMLGEAQLGIGPARKDAGRVIVQQSAQNKFRIIAQPLPLNDELWMIWNKGFGQHVPFVLSPQLHWSPDGEKFATIISDQRKNPGIFSLSVRDSSGKIAYDKSYSYRAIPIPGAVVDSELNASFSLKVAATEGPPNSEWQVLARKRLPATYSLVERILMGSDARVWITLRTTGAGVNAVVFDARGVPSATVQLPKGSRIEQADASQLWVTQRDDDGLPSVVRYRIAR